MARRPGLDRRTFLRGAGASALLSAAGVKPARGASLANAVLGGQEQVFDFDEIYDRFGTMCLKWDGAVQDMGVPIEVGMGVADLDFRAAPCITKALAERCEHEVWDIFGDRPSTRRRSPNGTTGGTVWRSIPADSCGRPEYTPA